MEGDGKGESGRGREGREKELGAGFGDCDRDKDINTGKVVKTLEYGPTLTRTCTVQSTE